MPTNENPRRMTSHIDRMKDECQEITARINRLITFIEENPLFETLAFDDRVDLVIQLQYMQLYQTTLARRIDKARSNDLNGQVATTRFPDIYKEATLRLVTPTDGQFIGVGFNADQVIRLKLSVTDACSMARLILGHAQMSAGIRNLANKENPDG